MGQEISSNRFERRHFHQFERRLVSEMALLHEMFRNQRFSTSPVRIGLELEAWLVDDAGEPQPRNEEFLQQLALPNVVPELSRFNVEFNVEHHALTGDCLQRIEQELSETWVAADRVARQLGLRMAACGILPTLREEQLCLETMSALVRYRALNEQVLRLRRGRPILLDIQGEEHLTLVHHDVMLEAAATSLQLHFQAPFAEASRYFNASVIASGPLIAIAANSPFLFGRRLWDETRIPVFEQAVDSGGLYPRVHFGSGYAIDSLEEFFLENRSCYPVLLPMEIDEPVELLPHVRLHNGTIWRWNRPLIGFDDSGQPHLRVEQRVMPAGPTLVDMLANLAFAAGLIHSLSQQSPPPEEELPFSVATSNFVTAARQGLRAEQVWLDGKTYSASALIGDVLLDSARQGLTALQVDSNMANRLLGVIADRNASGRNGAVWQREFVDRRQCDMRTLTRAYLARQQSGEPVHDWDFS